LALHIGGELVLTVQYIRYIPESVANLHAAIQTSLNLAIKYTCLGSNRGSGSTGGIADHVAGDADVADLVEAALLTIFIIIIAVKII
jgi:hypothetical protein